MLQYIRDSEVVQDAAFFLQQAGGRRFCGALIAPLHGLFTHPNNHHPYDTAALTERKVHTKGGHDKPPIAPVISAHFRTVEIVLATYPTKKTKASNSSRQPKVFEKQEQLDVYS